MVKKELLEKAKKTFQPSKTALCIKKIQENFVKMTKQGKNPHAQKANVINNNNINNFPLQVFF